MTNMLNAAQNKFWYGYGNKFADAPHTLSNEAFTAGARWSMQTTSALTPHIAQFIHMMVLLGYMEPETEDGG